MEVYDFDDYKAFLDAFLKALPKKGHGTARKLAEHLRVNSVVISQVLRGSKDFTVDQGLQVSRYLGLQNREQEFFLILVSKARAATSDLKKFYEAKLESLRKEAQRLKHTVPSRELGEIEKSVFYSNWYYSGVRILTTLEGKNTADAVASYFGLSRAKVGEILNFLVETGLLTEKNGSYEIGVSSTYVDSSSKFVNGHRRNWRLKAMDKFSEPLEDDLFYSSPHSISATDFEKARKDFSDLIQKHSKRVADSSPEVLACLNIDFFKF